MKKNASSRLTFSLLAAMLLSGLAPAASATPSDAAAPKSAAAGKSDAIKKYSTDETLRQGMNKISAALGDVSRGIQDKQLKGPAYVELAGRIEEQVAYVVKNCKLDPRADHALHEIVSDFNRANGLMRQQKLEVQHAGALAAQQALRNYARYFDHPGWTGPQ